jgi:hypothetical protein
MSDISESQVKRLKELGVIYKQLEEDIRVRKNYKETIGNEIKSIMEFGDIQKVDGLKLVTKTRTQSVTISALKEALNIQSVDNLLDRIVVEINIPESVENLKYLGGMQEPLANKIGKKLEELQEVKYIELEIGK